MGIAVGKTFHERRDQGGHINLASINLPLKSQFKPMIALKFLKILALRALGKAG